jgi:hypothetical protein
MLNVIMLSRYAECCYSECHYAECHYAECRGAQRIVNYTDEVCMPMFQVVKLQHQGQNIVVKQ